MAPNAQETAVIGIEGMSCDHCRRAIEEELGSLGGISQVIVDVSKKQAEVKFDPQTVSLDKIKSKIVDLGYET
jgi:copper chaperone